MNPSIEKLSELFQVAYKNKEKLITWSMSFKEKEKFLEVNAIRKDKEERV